MARTIAKATGIDASRRKETHRLGHMASTAEAATWRTFAEAHVNADGSGYVIVRRDGEILHRFMFDTENPQPTNRT